MNPRFMTNDKLFQAVPSHNLVAQAAPDMTHDCLECSIKEGRVARFDEVDEDKSLLP
jgi:hypothetical protein